MTMASVRSSNKVHAKERWPWMNEPSTERVSNDREDSKWIAMRRSSTSVWGTILEWEFEELISAIQNMIGAINSMQQRMTRHWRGDEDPEERKTPQRHDRRDQRGYRQDRDEREASQPTRRVEEPGRWTGEGLGDPQTVEEQLFKVQSIPDRYLDTFGDCLMGSTMHSNQAFSTLRRNAQLIEDPGGATLGHGGVVGPTFAMLEVCLPMLAWRRQETPRQPFGGWSANVEPWEG